MISCPGCGGRNEPDAKTCQWCARPFIAQPRRIPLQVLVLGAVAVVLVALGFAGYVGIRAIADAVATRAATSPTPIPPIATAIATATPAADATPATEGTTGPEFVRVSNTGGTGAFIRDEPRAAARGIAAYPDRTVLRIVGPDTIAEGRVWRSVEDPRGLRGWMPTEFLVASDSGF